MSILIPWIRNAEVLPECQKIQFDAGTGCMLSTLQVPYVKCKTNMQNPSTCCDLVALSLYLSYWFASTMGPTGFWRTLLRVSCYPYVCDAHIADTMQFHFQKVSPASQHQFGLLRSLKHHASKLLWNFGVHTPWTCGWVCMEHQLGSWSNSSAQALSFIVFSGLNPGLHLLCVWWV